MRFRNGMFFLSKIFQTNRYEELVDWMLWILLQALAESLLPGGVAYEKVV
jgi:hypothetical protein